MSVIEQVIQNAQKEVGVREDGYSNRGKRVDEYQRSDLLPGEGYAWCVSFIAWLMLISMGKELCDEVWLRSASCDSILYWARKRGILTRTPAAGRVGLVMASKNDATHGYLVAEVHENFHKTVEGNTNNSGARNGNGVYSRTRRNDANVLFVDWMKLLPRNPQPTSFDTSALPVVINPLAKAQIWELQDSKGRVVSGVPIIGGHGVIPAWKWAEWFGMDLSWNASRQTVSFNNKEITKQVRNIDGRAWLEVSDLVAATPELKLQVRPGVIQLSRGNQ